MSSLAHKIDNTLLKPEALAPEIHKIAADAMELKMAAVCVAPVWVGRVASMLRGSGVKVCAAISFPHGTAKSTVKAIEATSTIKDGADEIEVVAFLPPILSFELDASRAELMEIVRAARSTRRDVYIKVIVETTLLAELDGERCERAIETACRAIQESGCDAIVTATGLHLDRDRQPIDLVLKHAGELHVKALGDHGTLAALHQMAVHRIGITNAGPIFRQSET